MWVVFKSVIVINIFSMWYFLILDLPADRMGIRIGDEIEKVNDKSVRYSTHAQIVTTIHEVRRYQTVQYRVLRHHTKRNRRTNCGKRLSTSTYLCKDRRSMRFLLTWKTWV